MALSKSEIFLTFTIAVLTVFSICLEKCYLSEKNEKLRQIDLNAQLNIEKDNLQFAKNNIEAENQRLQERNVELGGRESARLQEIDAEIVELESQLRKQSCRDINAEAKNEGREEDETYKMTLAQDKYFRIKECTEKIKDLHKEFLEISFSQISAEAQVVVYRRHNEIMEAFLDQIKMIAEDGLVKRKSINIQALRNEIDKADQNQNHNLNEINNRINDLNERIRQLECEQE